MERDHFEDLDLEGSIMDLQTLGWSRWTDLAQGRDSWTRRWTSGFHKTCRISSL